MAHGLNAMLKRGTNTLGCKSDGKTGIGSRRIFAPQFKLQVLDSYRNDADCKGNQRATARKYGIHRRQIQKWLQVENNLRNSVIKNKSSELIVSSPEARKCGIELALRSGEQHRQRDDEVYSRRQRQVETETEAELERSTALRIGGPAVRDASAVDKRVPDIPQQHSPLQRDTAPADAYTTTITTTTTATLFHPQHQQLHHHQYEWQQQLQLRSSPDTSGSDMSHPPSPPLPLLPVVSPAAIESCECPIIPLDFTTHSRRATTVESPRASTSPCPPALPSSPIHYTTLNITSSESAGPMDLSLKKYMSPLLYPRAHIDLHAPVPILCPNTPPHVPCHPAEHHALPLLPAAEPQIWDLSTKGLKRQHDEISTSSTVSSSVDSIPPSSDSRPVKLFKPYLDNIDDEHPCNNDVKPIIVASADNYSDSEHYIYNNNNNNNMDFKMEYTFYKDDSHMEARNFYYPLNSDYYPNGGLHFSCGANYVEARDFVFSKTAIKQRQSYSLDFKLNAIECYYSDAVCRGNQRAVASKFKIHRRQVQKWLKQEQQLRQRNETTKPMHIVR